MVNKHKSGKNGSHVEMWGNRESGFTVAKSIPGTHGYVRDIVSMEHFDTMPNAKKRFKDLF